MKQFKKFFLVIFLSSFVASCSDASIYNTPTDGLVYEYSEEYNGYELVSFGSAYNSETIVIANTINGTPVTSVSPGAFKSHDKLVSLYIPKSIINIGENVFSGNDNLENVYYNGTIEDWCNIKLYDTPMSYAENFYILNRNNRFEELKEIKIPDGVTSIGFRQFKGFDNVTKVFIPNSVTAIGDSAFKECSSLESITLPFVGMTLSGEYDTHYFDSIFGSGEVPESLKEVIITGGTRIGSYAFDNCSSLTSIVIPDSVTTIGEYAFRNCTSLTSIVIPNSVTRIEGCAFYGCTSITIYCEATSEPSGWYSDWNYSNCPVVWGYEG